jgi:hypothetical protein
MLRGRQGGIRPADAICQVTQRAIGLSRCWSYRITCRIRDFTPHLQTGSLLDERCSMCTTVQTAFGRARNLLSTLLFLPPIVQA